MKLSLNKLVKARFRKRTGVKQATVDYGDRLNRHSADGWLVVIYPSALLSGGASSSQDWTRTDDWLIDSGPEVIDLIAEGDERHGGVIFGGGPQRGPGPRIEVPDGNRGSASSQQVSR